MGKHQMGKQRAHYAADQLRGDIVSGLSEGKITPGREHGRDHGVEMRARNRA